MTAKQLEAARKAIMKYIKRIGKLWITVFPSIPVTKKPTEIRMGKGKGEPSYCIFRIDPGRIIFEINGIEKALAKQALATASTKLNIKTTFVQKLDELNC